MAIKYTNIFQSKTLQNLPELGFLVRKQTIWQPCSAAAAAAACFLALLHNNHFKKQRKKRSQIFRRFESSAGLPDGIIF
jgi:hypothetical protein